MNQLLFLFGLLSMSSMLITANETRPNIVFILVDDLGRQDLGAYEVPFMKRLISMP